MNIQSILPNCKGRSINRKNSDILNTVFQKLPKNIIGRNGTVRSDIDKLSQKIFKCGDSAVSGTVKNSDGTFDSKILEMKRCGIHKLCPVCSDKVQGERMRKIDESLAQQWENVNYAYMLTFTVKDGYSLKNRLDLLTDGWRKWTLKGRKRGENFSEGEFSKILGASKSLEVILGEGKILDENQVYSENGDPIKKWHPHFHVIAFTNEPIDFRTYDQKVKAEASRLYPGEDQTEEFKNYLRDNNGYIHEYEDNNGNLKAGSKLTKEWHEVTNGEGENLDCSVIFTPKTKPFTFSSMFEKLTGKSKDEIKKSKKLSVLKSVKYALKYSVKPDELKNMHYKQVFEMFDVLKKVRTIEYSGFLYGYQGDKELRKWLLIQDLTERFSTDVEELKGLNYSELEKLKADLERPDKLEEYREWCSRASIKKYKTNNREDDIKMIMNNYNIGYWKPMEITLKNIDYITEVLDDASNGCEDSIKKEKEWFTKPETIYDDLTEETAPANGARDFYKKPALLENAPLTETAIYQLGADYHRAFKRDTSVCVQKWRKQRKQMFELYQYGKIYAFEYIQGVKDIEKDMKREIASFREIRDELINLRTKGLFSDVCRRYYPTRDTMPMKDIIKEFQAMPKTSFVPCKDLTDFKLDSIGNIEKVGF